MNASLVPSVVFFLAVALAPCSSAEDVLFPDTHAGRCAAAYLEAFNSGDEARWQKFEETHRAAENLRTRPMDERLAMYRNLRQRFGTLTLRGVLRSGEYDLSVRVAQSVGGDDLTMDFEFEPRPPHGLFAIRIAFGEVPGTGEAGSRPLTPEGRAQAVEALAVALTTQYVFAEKGAQMASLVRENARAGRYDAAGTVAALADALTRDVQSVSQDKHLRIRPSAEPPRAAASTPHDDDARLIREGPRENYGFERAEVLAGNVGYLKLNAFHHSREAQETAAAALAFLSRCDALIFDLRNNGGGSPEMIRFLSSYLFDKPTHLNNFYDRLSNKTSETWTLAEIPGRRFAPDLPVYVLTSGFTFSAAEEFTYNLQCLQRATIVGETTGGGAHPVRPIDLAGHLMVTMPFARAENPITKTNWEGVGVKPDIAAPADEALEAAQRDAREKLAKKP